MNLSERMTLLNSDDRFLIVRLLREAFIRCEDPRERERYEHAMTQIEMS